MPMYPISLKKGGRLASTTAQTNHSHSTEQKSRLQNQKGHGASIAKAGGKDHVGQRHDLLAKQSGAGEG